MGKFYREVERELELYVRQSAWLNAVPKTKEKKLSGAVEQSRLAAYRDKGETPPLPHVSAPYLYDYLTDSDHDRDWET